MKNLFVRGFGALALGTALAGATTSCTGDLEQKPKFEVTPDKVYVDLNGYRQVLAKVYGGFALTGQSGGAGNGDIQDIDEGTSDYLRQWWSAQELSTDEAVVAWGDPGIQDWHNMNWDANNVLIRGLYYRLYYQVALCNEFIREAADDKLDARLSGGDVASARRFRAEARFLRAVAYYHVLDLYGQGPFITEAGGVGLTAPPAATRRQLFDYVEGELKALVPLLAEARTNEYGRVDKAAAQGFLARLYLNAQVYTGQQRWADAATQAKAVVDAGYRLNTAAAPGTASAYGLNFLADNNVTAARNEIVWPIVFDATRTQGFGGTTFLINGSTASAVPGWKRITGQPTGGWNGLRTTRTLFDQFSKLGGDTARDTRARFWTQGQSLEIANLREFTQGLGVLKYRNVNSANVAQGALTPQNFSSVDFPMIRLSDMMLTYAEAVVRGGGDRATALDYVNQIRRRAYNGSTSANIGDAQLTADFLLDERSRELFWEGFRRTDLIRYNRFTEGTYLWPWKGGVAAGKQVEKFRDLYPIPVSDLTANPNLRQNTGYN